MGMLEGKVAVITGAGRGIGRATAEVFVREGAKVLVVDISGNEKATAAELGSAAVPFHADLREEGEIAALGDAAVAEFGRVDALVNVAGTPAGRSPEFLSAEEFEVQNAVNLRGVLLCTKYAIQAMLQNGDGGSIVSVSSVAGLNVEERSPVVYQTAKAGVHALTKAVAVEYGPRGIRANVIAPGFTLTEMNRRASPEVLRELSAKAALGRAGEAREQ
ncbi:MAG: SDR family NAD(P)-dependent oxidoreductase, partial [Frankia sp.]